MDRAEELRSLLDLVEDEQKIVIRQLIEELIFIEKQMNEIREIPFIRSNPNNPSQQKRTEAAKQYKELSQSYMNGIRILSGVLRRESEGVETDPVQEFLDSMGKQNG